MSENQSRAVTIEAEPMHLRYQEDNDDDGENLQTVSENSTKSVAEAKSDVYSSVAALAAEKPVATVSSKVLSKEMAPVKVQAEISFDDIEYDDNGVPIIPYEKLFNIKKDGGI